MDSAPFSCAEKQISEIDIASGPNAQLILEWHWDTFITEDHVKHLASMGINTVRLPIGYWSAGPDWISGSPYENWADVYANSWNRVLRMVSWCEKYKMGLLVDLHGAYGSQNGESAERSSLGRRSRRAHPLTLSPSLSKVNSTLASVTE